MTPLHPLLRRALLAHENHWRLTPTLLDEYEALVAQLYDSEVEAIVKIRTKPITKTQKKTPGLVDKINQFRSTFMPNYDDVRQAWAEHQKKNIMGRYSLPKLMNFMVVVPIIIIWIIWILIGDLKSDSISEIGRQTIILVSLISLFLGLSNIKNPAFTIIPKLRYRKKNNIKK
ncbi:MAG: hypothetical protein DWQ05_23025 [Calditrichaeota bacterium]|nr:MAG: hypothetical protein DWQ05_23025 [Calditrichota bacterium]